MAITARYNTPRKYKTRWTSTSLSNNVGFGADGTYNGGSFNGTAANSILTDRWFFAEYVDAGSAANKRNSKQWNWTLPDDYKDGTDIKVSFIWTSSETSVQIEWTIGVRRLNAGALGTETETEYQNAYDSTDGTGVFNAYDPGEYTFSGTNFVKGEQLVINILRRGDLDQGNDSAYICMINIAYETESVNEEIGEHKIMTPVKFRTVYREFSVDGFTLEADAGTFNGNTTTAAGEATLSDRWRTKLNTIPKDYIPGTDITLVLELFNANITTTGDAVMLAGLCTDTLGNQFGDESDTEYISNTIVSTPTTAFERFTTSFTFSGTNQNAVDIQPGDPISFIIVRDGNNVADTNDADVALVQAKVRYQIEQEGLDS
jgi:hypothetical protein